MSSAPVVVSLVAAAAWTELPTETLLAARVWRERAEPRSDIIGPEQFAELVGDVLDYRDTAARNLAAGRRTCRVCGCWEFAACAPSCWWVAADLCSACNPGETG